MIYEIFSYEDFKRATDEVCEKLSAQAVDQEKIFDCKLTLYELIGNVLQHSGGSAGFEVGVEEGYIQITVRAERVFIPPVKGKCPSAESERGRGLYLVDSVCAGREFTDEGRIVVRIALE